MTRRRVYLVHGHPATMTIRLRKPYTFGRFIFDCFMVAITGGLWLIWMIIRTLFF